MTFESHKPRTDESPISVSAKLQQAVDSVYETRANQPLDQVRPALRKALRDVGLTVHEETLDTIAQYIAAGTPVDTTPPG